MAEVESVDNSVALRAAAMVEATGACLVEEEEAKSVV